MTPSDDDLPPGYRWMRELGGDRIYHPPTIVQRTFRDSRAEALIVEAWRDFKGRIKEAEDRE